jgi:hypothetical protein
MKKNMVLTYKGYDVCEGNPQYIFMKFEDVEKNKYIWATNGRTKAFDEFSGYGVGSLVMLSARVETGKYKNEPVYTLSYIKILKED